MAEGYKDFIAGTVGGFSGKLLDYPLDTVKVLLQTQNSLVATPTNLNLTPSASSTSPITNSPLSTTLKSAAANAAKNAANNGPKASPAPPASPSPVFYRGAIHCLKHQIKHHGFFSLYKGIPSPLLGSMAENATLFLAYGEIKRLMGERDGKELSLPQLCMAGGIAGGIVSFVLNPFEVIKVQMQVTNSAAVDAATAAAAAGTTTGTSSAATLRKYNGFVDCILQTLRNEGLVNGLYRGLPSLLYREIPGNVCWYGTYESVCHLAVKRMNDREEERFRQWQNERRQRQQQRRYSSVGDGIGDGYGDDGDDIDGDDNQFDFKHYTKRDLTLPTHLLGGATAGVAYWTAFYPADTVGSQMRANPLYASRSFWNVFGEIYRTEGLRGLYRGWGITAIRAAPSHALIFGMYEQTMGVFRRWDPMHTGFLGEEEVEEIVERRSGSLSHGS